MEDKDPTAPSFEGASGGSWEAFHDSQCDANLVMQPMEDKDPTAPSFEGTSGWSWEASHDPQYDANLVRRPMEDKDLTAPSFEGASGWSWEASHDPQEDLEAAAVNYPRTELASSDIERRLTWLQPVEEEEEDEDDGEGSLLAGDGRERGEEDRRSGGAAQGEVEEGLGNRDGSRRRVGIHTWEKPCGISMCGKSTVHTGLVQDENPILQRGGTCFVPLFPLAPVRYVRAHRPVANWASSLHERDLPTLSATSHPFLQPAPSPTQPIDTQQSLMHRTHSHSSVIQTQSPWPQTTPSCMPFIPTNTPSTLLAQMLSPVIPTYTPLRPPIQTHGQRSPISLAAQREEQPHSLATESQASNLPIEEETRPLCHVGAPFSMGQGFEGGGEASIDNSAGWMGGPQMMYPGSSMEFPQPCYVCSVCGMQFIQRSQFTTHQSIHTEATPYQPSASQMLFRDTSKPEVHQGVRPGEQPDGLYICKICEKGFKSKGARSSHERIHREKNEYPCSVCGKVFKWPSTASEHKVTHTGEKPYECTVCGLKFSRKSNLLRH